MLNTTHKKGFSLIEILVAVSIGLIITGGGIASYINFNDRQSVAASGKVVGSFLRLAQKRARVGDKPTGCTKLLGYTVRAVSDSNALEMVAVCQNNTEFASSSETLIGNATFDSGFAITFGSLQGGVTGASTISLSNGSDQFTLDVTAGGEITQGELSSQ